VCLEADAHYVLLGARKACSSPVEDPYPARRIAVVLLEAKADHDPAAVAALRTADCKDGEEGDLRTWMKIYDEIRSVSAEYDDKHGDREE
jgi:hypothetical protein